MALKIMHQKIDQISKIKEEIENHKKMICEKENEINLMKKLVNMKKVLKIEIMALKK